MCDSSSGSGSHFTAVKDGESSCVPSFEDSLDALQKKLEDLSRAKEDVKREIDVAEQKYMRRRRKEVQVWLTRVEEVETQVDQVQRLRSQQVGKSGLGGFPWKNRKSSYMYAKLLKDVGDLKDEGETFGDVAETTFETLVYERTSEPTVGLESKLEEVWRHIGDKQVRVIRLYGKGGVGKTTLLTQVNNKFLSSFNDFYVIWVTMSTLEALNADTIGKRIGLWDDEWNDKPFEEKARDIFRILNTKKFVLLLDDVWGWVDLVSIGIPPPTQNLDYKVVFTTRSVEDCCRMSTHKNVEVECLKHEEAWRLFQMKVGEETLNSHPDIPALAEAVVKACGGLPLALIITGRAMATKRNPEEWNRAISILRNSAHEFPGMENQVYRILMSSYHDLPSDTQKSCFLYCSLFPEDYHIAKRDLVDCWISEGFLEKYDGIIARNFGYNIIEFLIRASLLEEGENDNFVKMYDVIRNMALWIASKLQREQKQFLVCSGVGLTEAPEVEIWNDVKRLSLMENKIASLSMIPYCPELLTLFLQNNPLRKLKSGFFQHMPRLRVLNLSRTDLTEVPKGISELVKLQHLDLSWTKIIELPEELKALRNLKCLNLEETEVLCKIPRQVISNLSMLRVLRMFKCGLLSNESEDSIRFDECELFIEELVHLRHLNVFSIHLKNSRALQRFLNSHELQNYPAESVSLQLADSSRSLNVLSLGVLKDLQTLFIRSEDLVELVTDREMQNVSRFHNLHKVQLFACTKLRDATWLMFAPGLEILEISNCNDMKEIISYGDEVPEMTKNLLPFAKLKHLLLQFLEKLESIYCNNPLPFLRLKQIFIKGCPNLRKLPLDSNSMTNSALKIRGEQHWWNELRWEDQATQNHFRPYFKAFDD